MTTALTASYKENLLDTLIANTVKVILIDTADDTINVASDDELADITAGAIVATATLGSKTQTGGVFDSADPTWTAVSGDGVEAVGMYDDTVSGDPIVGNWDFTPSVTPNGGNIIGTVGNPGWFTL